MTDTNTTAPSTAPATNDNTEEPPIPSLRRAMTDGIVSKRLLRVDQIYSRKDRQIHYVRTAKASSRPGEDRSGRSKTALIVRRIISRQGMVSGTEVTVQSPFLQKFFQDYYKGVEGLELNKTPPVAKPELIFWCIEELLKTKEEEMKKPQPDRNALIDLEAAIRFVQEDYSGQLASLHSLFSEGQVTFDLLWAIFPPRECVIAPKYGIMKQEQALYLVDADYGRRQDGSRYYNINGRILSHDGRDFGESTLAVVIEGFEGAMKLTDLTAYPMKYHPEQADIRQRLLERGKKYVALLEKPVCKEYTATFAIKEIALANGGTKTQNYNAKGRVMVDHEGFYLHNPYSDLNLPYTSRDNNLTFQTVPDRLLLVAASWINGFCFDYKTWCQLAITPLEDVVWNHEAFKKLVMDENRRRLVHGLVKAHRHEETAFDDIVQNKGRGLVGLLSGPPGVGKTLTAEAVAEVTERPLYMVNSGELGIDAPTVDKQLNVILDITRRWGCVLLIDEADVFLGARGGDLARDTLVSIFLRRLEYFMGVCILTTNRQSIIDQAFQSRIHFTIQYPELNEASRKAVWKNFIEAISKKSDACNISEEDINRLASHILNGRQIKNAVSCAISLARESGQPVTVTDIENILGILVC